MDGGVVQHVPALRHPQEARALLKGLRPQLRHLFQRRPGGERPVFLPENHDVFRHCGVDSRHPGQQRNGSGVQIHPDGVDAVLHHPVQRLAEVGLGHIVLILPHPDGLGIDLHQLGQRILQPPGNGHRGTQGNVVFGKFLRRQLGGGVDGGSRLADHHIG